jgi:hypothetical protein
MKGRRVDADPNDPNQYPFPRLEPGDYGKDVHGVWHCCAPRDTGEWYTNFHGCLRGHTVTEHEDGTITVSPSILITQPGVGIWHGFLERGVWREC